jgi:hypothetical protein
LQPGLTLVHPVTGFHVDSVHSIADLAIVALLSSQAADADAEPSLRTNAA